MPVIDLPSLAKAPPAPVLRLATLLLLSAASAIYGEDQKPPAAASEDTWQVIYIGEQRIGYSHSTIRPLQRDGRELVRTRNEMKMQIKRFGQSLKVETLLETDETPAGDLLGFTMEMKNPPAGTSRTAGRVEGDRLVLEKTNAGRTTTSSIPWDQEVKSPAWQDRALRDDPLRPGQSRSFKTFMPEFNTVATIRIAADDRRTTRLLDGQSRELLKVQITQSVLPGMTVRSYVDDEGETLKTEMDFLGQTMTTYTVPAAEALEEIAEGGELDLAVNTLVRVERKIRNPHETRQITYRITIASEDPAGHLIDGGAQVVKSIDGSTAEVTITRIPIPETARAARSASEYLDPTEYLQSTDRRVVDHARHAAAAEVDPARVARRMERYVHDKLSKKDFSTALATAAEVAESLQGDCTEHAVLLAAMLRAQKIPSRIAVGLVYVDSLSSFGGHMWTEALLGDTWVPLDATLGQGGVGAAHIKLAESSFADEGPAPVTSFLPLLKILGQMQIEVLDVE